MRANLNDDTDAVRLCLVGGLMNKFILFSCFFAVFSSAFAQQDDADLVNKVLYGVDNRMDVFEAPSAYVNLAQATAGMIMNVELKRTLFRYKLAAFPKTYEERYNLCSGERFAAQLTATRCTGFLVAPDVLVTAGHCVQNETQCVNSSWIFDFNAESGDVVKTTFPVRNVYKCQSIIAREKNLETQNDFAVIRLDRAVKGRTPLKVRLAGKIDESTELLIIGHPASLPTKIVDGGTIRTNDNPVFFNANIDSFGGNSGSPVMDARTGLVEGILVRGEKDFIYDAEKSCYTTNVCIEGSCRGEDATRITNIASILQPLIK